MKYSYAVLQYRHEIWSGEAMNIGVLVFCRSAAYLKLKTRRSGGRLSAAYPNLDRPALTEDLNDLKHGFKSLSGKVFEQGTLFCTELPTLGAEGASDLKSLAYHVLKHDASSFRWSTFGTGVTSDIHETHQILFDRFVLKNEQKRDEARRSDDDVFESLQQQLRDVGIAGKLQPHVVSAPLLDVEFKHSIKNGVWHCVQPLSFDLKTHDGMVEKANTWTGNLYHLRDHPDFRAYFITGKPKESPLLPAYNRALAMLRSAPTTPIVVEETNAGTLVDYLVAAARHSAGPH
ncbi:DUF3037 domain-containing protein [Xinfangfangia sp. D13-10-4-6]|nr:DUF3037 domain-containing protein [Pseudogemmobacter hezensis]NPD16947.1 DUF3037 domain-containing protein [Pseudogemmobacter hezensis]